MVYRLPFTRLELKDYLENHSAFKNKPKMPIQIFTKVFYPNMSELENNKKRKNSKGSDASSEDDNFDDTYSKRVQNLPDNLSSIKSSNLNLIRGGSSSGLQIDGLSS